jgi:hypothetical protein
MCIRRYHTSKGIPKVRPINVEKDTGKSIYINGRRRAKYSQWDNYHNTHAEAKEHILRIARNNVEGCTKRLQAAELFLHKAQSITKQ